MNIGIIGTGRIAKRFVPECRLVPGAEITAVYNPHAGSAERFVEQAFQRPASGDEIPGGAGGSAGTEEMPGSGFVSEMANGRAGFPQALHRIDDLWEPVDSVYIASPHETHIDYVKAALEHDKHVLCEKPLAFLKHDAEDVFALAADRGLVLLEGLKTAYAPGYQKLIETTKSGIIGEIRYIDACFTKLENPESRELTDRAYGGSFLELGSYVLLPVFDLLGASYQHLSFDSLIGETGSDDTRPDRYRTGGIDLFTKAAFRYENAMATLVCGLGVKSEGRLVIGGTKGYIVVPAPWWKTMRFEAHFENPSDVRVYEETFEGDGLRYEIREFINRVENKQTLPSSHEIQRSIWMAEVMEQFYRQP